jgi:hypothetical protein
MSATSQQQIGVISGFQVPAGMAVDARGSVYIADASGQSIYKFARGATKPSLVLQDPGMSPMAVAVARDGTIWVANVCNGSWCQSPGHVGPGNVLGYAPGATTRSITLTPSGLGSPLDVAVSSTGQVIAGGFVQQGCFYGYCLGAGLVGAFGSDGSFTRLRIPFNSPRFTKRLRLDKQGRVVVLDGENTLTMFEFPTGAQVGTVKLVESPRGAGAIDFAFSSDGSAVWTAVSAPNGDFSWIGTNEVDYASGQLQLVMGNPSGASFGIVIAVAVSPGLIQ